MLVLGHAVRCMQQRRYLQCWCQGLRFTDSQTGALPLCVWNREDICSVGVKACLDTACNRDNICNVGVRACGVQSPLQEP